MLISEEKNKQLPLTISQCKIRRKKKQTTNQDKGHYGVLNRHIKFQCYVRQGSTDKSVLPPVGKYFSLPTQHSFL